MIQRNTLIQLALYSILFTYIYGNLIINSPKNVNDRFVKGIQYGLANFGHVPYGRKFSGQIELPQMNGSYIDMKLCQPQIKLIPESQQTTSKNKWMIVERGNCTFVQKAINAQEAGAQMLIIVDNIKEMSESLILADDGNGYLVHIPTIFLSEDDGQFLIQQLKVNSSIEVWGSMSFNDTRRAQIPYVLFGLNLRNRESFKLIREFKQYYDNLKNDVQFEIYYETYPCWLCSLEGFNYEVSDCLGGGRYCSLDPDGWAGVATGRQVLYENIRQACLFKIDQDYWWTYMNIFDKECLQAQAYDQCHKSILAKNEKLYQKINRCIMDSFESKETNQNLQQNTIMDKWIDFRDNSGIVFYPGAAVNNVTFRGNIDAQDLAEDICSGMSNISNYCQTLYSNLNEQSSTQVSEQQNSYVGLLVFIAVLCVVFLLFMTFIYRRMLRRELSQEMGQQVNQMVSQYISFYESKSSRNITQEQ